MSQAKRNIKDDKVICHLAICAHQYRQNRIKEPRRIDVKKSMISPHMKKPHS